MLNTVKLMRVHLKYLDETGKRITNYEAVEAIVGMIGCFFAIVESDIYFSNIDKKHYEHTQAT